MVKVILVIGLFCLAVIPSSLWRMQNERKWSEFSHETTLDPKEIEAEKATANTANLQPDDDRRVDAQLRLAKCKWDKKKYSEAEQILSDLWYTRYKPNGNYDERFADIVLTLAEVHRDKGSDGTEDMVKNYESMYWYDTHFTDTHTAARLARDLNNLGLSYYLLGLSKPHIAEAMPFYRKAIDYFEDALPRQRQLYGRHSQYEANTLSNEYICLREMGEATQAGKVLATIQFIETKSNRPFTLP